MVLSIEHKNWKTEVYNKVIVLESGSKFLVFIAKCQECNEELRKAYAAIQTVLYCFVCPPNGL